MILVGKAANENPLLTTMNNHRTEKFIKIIKKNTKKSLKRSNLLQRTNMISRRNHIRFRETRLFRRGTLTERCNRCIRRDNMAEGQGDNLPSNTGHW